MGDDQNGDMFSSLRRLAQTGGMVPRSIRQSQRQLCTKPTKPVVDHRKAPSSDHLVRAAAQKATQSRQGMIQVAVGLVLSGCAALGYMKQLQDEEDLRMVYEGNPEGLSDPSQGIKGKVRIEGIICTWQMTDLYHYGYLAQEVVAQENYKYSQTKLLSVFVGSI